MKHQIFLYIFLLFVVVLAAFYNMNRIEGFSNYFLNEAGGQFPEAQTSVLVQDTYPPIGKNELSNKDAYSIFTQYPVFSLGSYEQITNNIKYPKNPDNGTCMPSAMCDALYYNKVVGDNVFKPLPPVTGSGKRVGYFIAENSH